MSTRTWHDRLAKGRSRVTGAYHRTIGELVQRHRSKRYVAQQNRAPVADRDPALTRTQANREQPQARTGPADRLSRVSEAAGRARQNQVADAGRHPLRDRLHRPRTGRGSR